MKYPLSEMKIKVCGMKYSENIQELAQYKPDYLGFIFYEKSKRFVGDELDPTVLKNLDDSIKKVGVFVNHSNDFIHEQVKKYNLDLLQLHGEESVAQCKELKQNGNTIIKVFQVDEAFDFATTESYKQYSDYFLFDTKSKDYGGTGIKFNWNILKRYDNEIPLFLSGGVDLKSIEEMNRLGFLNIHALDINSKFELAPATKDIKKVKLFIDHIKNEIRS
ncbi:MAG TPA: phosphoribosylanthranilate isomerase [Cytophagaceae bacterium]|jgi:phosphoribosylanthranilate isomerase|nr:phosphoribosylanthranilate isomerase [Cytophagaceae bacterium]